MKIALLLLSITLGFQTQVKAQVPQKTPPAMKLSDQLPANLFVELGRIINPAVVNISTSALPRGRQSQMQQDPLRELLEQFYGITPRQQLNRPRQMSLGTGFVVRDDGLIVTNAHVVAGADVINVQLTEGEGKTYVAKVIGSDQRSDIALIKIEADKKLPVAALGSSAETQVGEWVAAFGNPFGHGHSMTKGIISSKGREIGEINKIPLLQTDASINPGNSGGPLVNAQGYVIGVNSAIDARAQGIGFAIPIDEVKKILPDLEKRGRIRRGYIGVSLGELDPRAAAELGMEDGTSGAIIMNVNRGEPAAKAGLKPYDIVTEVNGKKIRRSLDFMDSISDAPIGKKVPVQVLRDQKVITLNVEVIERPSDEALTGKAMQGTGAVEGQEIPQLGMSVAVLTSEQKSEWGFSQDLDKPVITNIQSKSTAARGGLLVGDVILEVNRKNVAKVTDITKNLKRSSNSFKIIRQNRMILVTITN